MSTFFVCAPLFADMSCQKRWDDGHDTEKVRVKWVYDGDTVKLTDNRNLRIIGIDTPERARKQQKSEPYAGQATEALRELLSKHRYRIVIKYGKQKTDKYGRMLAHVFTLNGTNVSEWMLKQGLATLLVIPPNYRYLECYQNAERQARNNKRKLWKLKQYQPQTTAALNHEFTGYVRLTGTVKRIKRRKNKISITLDHQIYITIKKPDLNLFNDLDTNLRKGQSIQVTGILYRQGKKGYIRVRHPAYLDTNY